MDWQKAWYLLDIVHKARDIPEAKIVRNMAMAELSVLHEQPVETEFEEPQADIGEEGEEGKEQEESNERRV